MRFSVTGQPALSNRKGDGWEHQAGPGRSRRAQPWHFAVDMLSVSFFLVYAFAYPSFETQGDKHPSGKIRQNCRTRLTGLEPREQVALGTPAEAKTGPQDDFP